jgi:hypothetical protein
MLRFARNTRNVREGLKKSESREKFAVKSMGDVDAPRMLMRRSVRPHCGRRGSTSSSSSRKELGVTLTYDGMSTRRAE